MSLFHELITFYAKYRADIQRGIAPKDHHIVIVSQKGETLYDNFNLTGFPYQENPAVKQAFIKGQGQYQEGDLLYLAYREGTCNQVVVLISNEVLDINRPSRLTAWYRLAEVDRAIVLNDARLVAEQYTENANFCSPGGCKIGRPAIYKEFANYFKNGGETNQFTQTLTFAYDPMNYRGVIERIWNATIVATGESYQQDDAITYQLAEDGRLKHLAEFFDPAQRKSNIIEVLP